MSEAPPEGTAPPRRFRRGLTVRMLAANAVTTLALAAGMTAIRFAIEGRYEAAVAAVIAAGVLDGLDGAIARLLKSASRFGAELDSLSDVVAFGMAPAFLLYSWGLSGLGRIGWVLALAFGVATALRLARYNSKLDNGDDPRKRRGYFTGVPAPAGAGLALLPMILDFAFETAVFQSSIVLGLYTALIALLLVSTLPTFSFKQLRIGRDMLIPALMVVALFAASITVYRWAAIAVVAVLYLSSIPVAWHLYRRGRTRKENGRAATPPPEEG